jgi:hypothetical protein
MANDTPDVTMRAPSGKQYTVPRGNLAKARAMGWSEVTPTAKPEVKKENLFDVFSVETARGMGLDPEKIQRIGGKSTGKQALEAGREVTKNIGDWMTRVGKDPFKVMEPFHAAASGLEKGVGDVSKVLTEEDRNSPDFMKNLVGAGGRLTGSAAMTAAGIEAPEAAKIPGSVAEGVKAIPEGAGNFARKTSRSIADRDPAAVAEAAKKVATREAASSKIAESNTKLEAAKTQLQQRAQSSGKALTENLNKTIDTIKTAFDSEYGDFDAKVLGKTAQNPKGTLQAELSPLAQSVKDAQANLITGSEESIKQFKSILGRLSKDYLDVGEGQLGIAPGQKIPAADLRGYITEMESKIYDSNLEPDVRQAVKSVVESGKKELGSTIQRNFGPGIADAFKDLNSRYSDYLRDWRDPSKVNPLPNLRNILLEGVVRNNPAIQVDLASKIPASKVQAATALLEKYRKFGANPDILKDYRQALEQMKALPKSLKVPEVKPFDSQQFIREGVASRMRTMGHWGTGMAIVSFILDILHGNAGAMMTAAERVAAVQVLKGMLTGDKFLDWVSKEPTKAKEGAQ